MPFTQETFFGASIRNFRAGIGWGSEVSTLNISLVEDPVNNDNFSPDVAIGQPTVFEYQGWVFRGLLQNWQRSQSEGGKPLYEVILKDPREIIQGVQLIIDGYTGSTYSVPNLYNIYGYLENTLGYGRSEKNDSGIPWQLIRNAFQTLQLSSPMTFRGYGYTIDLSLLPLIPAYYRVGGTEAITLYDFIAEICGAGARDFFFTLEAGSVIKLHTISRNIISNLGAIENYISSMSDGSVQNETGIELIHEVTSKFLVGGAVEQLWLQGESDDEDDDPNTSSDHYDNTIWPYWGLDTNGNAIIGKGYFTPLDGDVATDIQEFTINISELNMEEFPGNYRTDIYEIQALLGGIDTWQTFLFFNNETASPVSPDENPHHGKATRLGIPAFMRELKDLVLGTPALADVKFMTPTEAIMNGKSEFQKLKDHFSNHADKIKMLFEYLSNFAEEHYGRKFMVRIPFVYSANESETGQVLVSQEPCDSGYVEESALANAVANGYLAPNLIKFEDEFGKIVAYVRFDGVYDPSDLNVEDFYYDVENLRLFVKCEVEPQLVYLDRSTYYSPRAVITLPGRVKKFYTEKTENYYTQLIKRFLTGNVEGITDADIQKKYSMFGADSMMFNHETIAYAPNLAAVPLRSNILCYGPWYNIGVSGKTEFEKDATLVPWNYSGFTQMNYVGSAKVSETISNSQYAESGSITFPGVPTITIGSLLISGGPYVTDVSVDIGENGATTTYRMKTWTTKFGKVPRQVFDRLQRLNNLYMRQRAEFREFLKRIRLGGFGNGKRQRIKGVDPRHDGRKSTHPLICADIHVHEDSDARKANIVISPAHNIDSHMEQDYDKKAMGSLDTIFRPFATKTTDSNFPHFETPEANTTVNVEDLNPFTSPHDMTAAIMNDEIPDNGLVVKNNGSGVTDYRAIGLRMPMIGVGWGYDTNGKPVPNATPNSPGDNFATDYRTRMDLWKAGPVDMRWDNNRKVWIASSRLVLVELNERLDPGGEAEAEVLELVGGAWVGTGTTVTVNDRIYRTFGLTGEQIWVSEDGNGEYESLGEYGLDRAVTTYAVTAGSSVSMPLKVGSEYITVAYDWMTGGEDLESGKQGLARYYPEERLWRLVAVEC